MTFGELASFRHSFVPGGRKAGGCVGKAGRPTCASSAASSSRQESPQRYHVFDIVRLHLSRTAKMLPEAQQIVPGFAATCAPGCHGS